MYIKIINIIMSGMNIPIIIASHSRYDVEGISITV